LETIGQEDQIPMTFDTAKISELVALRAETLLGIPEKRLCVPPLGICLDYPGSFPPDLISGEVGGKTGEVFVVIADQDTATYLPLILMLRSDLSLVTQCRSLPEGI
jgi:hypothetical protein